MNTLRSTVSGMKPTDLALAALATARLTRVLTTDWIGEWTIVRPIKRWADKFERPRVEAEALYRQRVAMKNRETELADVPLPEVEGMVEEDQMRGQMIRQAGQEARDRYLELTYDSHDPLTWQAKLASGFDCPHCCGMWVGAGVLGSLLVAQRFPTLLPVWRFVIGALGLSYITGHTSSRLDS